MDLPYLLSNGTAQQRKALLRKLIKEIRVMSKGEILPTYKLPAAVRAPSGQVELRGHHSNSIDSLRQLFSLVSS